MYIRVTCIYVDTALRVTYSRALLTKTKRPALAETKGVTSTFALVKQVLLH